MKKLLIFMIDALCSCDVEYMKTLPNFKKILDNGSYVKHLLPVHPALTYCCHTSIITGTYVDRHGIHNNDKYDRNEGLGKVWFGKKSDVKVKTLLDYASDYNMTTCSLAWPVSAGANYTYNFPMIVPYGYSGDHPEDFLNNGNATNNLMEKYFWKYGRFLKGPNSSLDSITMALAPDIIRDFGQPDVMAIKMCDLDDVRHTYGVYHPNTLIKLKEHDEEFGVILESIRKYGDYNNTNFVIIGDHGQTDINDILNINKLLEKNGFLTLDKTGNILDYKALAHSAALSCFIELKCNNDIETYNEVYDFLNSLKYDPKIKLDYVLTKKEMKELYHLDGPFDFLIESANNISFSEKLNVKEIWQSVEPGDHILGKATHGGNPNRQEVTTFIASGPSVKKGVVIDSANMVDEAITMAKMIGIDMPNTDGKLLEDMLNGSKN